MLRGMQRDVFSLAATAVEKKEQGDRGSLLPGPAVAAMAARSPSSISASFITSAIIGAIRSAWARATRSRFPRGVIAT